MFFRPILIDVVSPRFAQNRYGRIQLLRLCDFRRRSFLVNGKSFSSSVGAGKNVEARKKESKSKLDHYAGLVDRKIAESKILSHVYEPKANPLNRLRLVYRHRDVTRVSTSYGIWAGYGVAGLSAIGLAFNVKGLWDECVDHPFFCVFSIFICLSYSAYLSYAARSYIATIHVRDLPKVPTFAKNRSGKMPADNIITCVNPLTGAVQRLEFDFDDVKVFDPESTKPMSRWRRFLNYIDPAKANVLIGNRWFRMEGDGFIDNDFREQLIAARGTRASKSFIKIDTTEPFLAKLEEQQRLLRINKQMK